MSSIATLAVARLKDAPYALRKSWIDRWGSAEKLLEAVRARAAVSEDDRKSFAFIEKRIDLKSAERELEKLKKRSIWMLAYGSAGYPELLREIPDPPLVLFGVGTMPPAESAFLGFVGPRKPSTYGTRIARMLAEDLAREGVVLVSGLARGIDAIAHEAALKEGTPTVAVIACGLDKVYPPEHSHLQERISKGGAVLTEFPLGEPPRAEHFPQRNRIISGLSRGVLVIEAGERSGAGITGRHAAEQSREVFAVPGPIDSPLSFGTNKLIAEGAKLVATSADVLHELIPSFRPGAKKKIAAAEKLSGEQRRLLDRLERDVPVSADELAGLKDFPLPRVLQTLSELQIKGLVEKQPDARYVRTGGNA